MSDLFYFASWASDVLRGLSSHPEHTLLKLGAAMKLEDDEGMREALMEALSFMELHENYSAKTDAFVNAYGVVNEPFTEMWRDAKAAVFGEA